ncbi:hypothetical protein [Pedobacter agri]|uniref:hypothetical protein n=1 Tax=Pedobacter agri TaxID=454586 RepID=UPI002930AD5E|nr:hypothetical protein [Pedobacter agri]
MNSFLHFVEYCKRSDEGESLQRFLIIWNEKYPSMIRRCLAMDLKDKLDNLPSKEKSIDLKALIQSLSTLVPSIQNIEAKTENIHRVFNHKLEPIVKKLTKKQQIDAEIKRQIEAERLSIIKKLNQN